MSYFSNNKIYDKYILDGTVSPNQSPYTKDIIEIFNNQIFYLDLSNIIFTCSDDSVSNQQFTKLRIDWGDGHSDVLSKPLSSKASTISTYDPISWKQQQHLYNVEKRYEYDEGISAASLPKIEVTLYNTFNDRVKIYIPYKMVYKTIYDIGSKFSLVSANVNNRNLVSYVLKQHKDDTMLIISSGDWERHHGQIVQRIHDIKNMSSADYSNEFVNEDSIVWNWKSVPQVQMTINLVGDYFQCKFQQRTINVQEWTPRCQKLGYENETIETQIIDFKNKYFKTENKLERGIYKLWLDMVGINQIEGQSQTIYKVIPQDSYTAPSKLQSRNTFVQFDYSTQDGLNYITSPQFNVTYTLGNYQFQVTPNMIKSAKVIFELNSISKIHTDGGNGYQDVTDDVSFEFDLPFSPTPINDYVIKNYDKIIAKKEAQTTKIINNRNGFIDIDRTINFIDIPQIKKIEIGFCEFEQRFDQTDAFTVDNYIGFKSTIDDDQSISINGLSIDTSRFYKVYNRTAYIQHDGIIYDITISEPSIMINCYDNTNGFEIDEVTFTDDEIRFENYIGIDGIIYPKNIFATVNDVSTVYQLTDVPVVNKQSLINTQKLVIDTSSIPDGIYTTKIIVQDVLGNVQQKIYNDESELQLPIFTVKYPIGEIQSLTIDIDDEKFDELTVNWSVENETQTDQMSIKIGDIVNLRQSADKFDDGVKNDYNYSYTIPTYKIPDGDLTVDVNNIVNMTLFGGDRRTSKTITKDFNYKRPNVTITDVNPYIVVANEKITTMCDIVAKEQYDRRLSEIKLKNDQKDIDNLTNLSWSGDISKVKNKSIYIVGYDRTDKIHKRSSTIQETTPCVISDLIYDLEDDKKSYSMLKNSSTVETINNYSMKYQRESEGKKMTLGQLKSQSLVDINKNCYYRRLSDGKRFYGYVNETTYELPYYVIDGVKKYIAFTPQKYFYEIKTDAASETANRHNYYRFVGDKSINQKVDNKNDDEKFELIKLVDAEKYIVGEKQLVQTKYDSENDIGIINFYIREYHDPYEKDSKYVDGGIITSNIYIKDANGGNVIKKVEYTNEKQRPISIEVPLGDYTAYIQNVNLFVKSDKEMYTYNDVISIGPKPEDCITFTKVNQIISPSGTFRYNIAWQLHHKQVTQFELHIKQYYTEVENGADITVGEVTYKTWIFEGNTYVIDNGVIKQYYENSATEKLQQYMGSVLRVQNDQIIANENQFVYNVMDLNYYIPLTQFRGGSAKHKLWVTLKSPYIKWEQEDESLRKIDIPEVIPDSSDDTNTSQSQS